MLYFTKMQGLGNDFICLDYDKVSRYNLKIFSKYICDRHFGIGADGVLLYSKSKIADCKMRIFNSDGTEAGMCGNGIRCLSRFMYEKGYVPKNKMKIETISGIKNIECITQNAKIMSIKVDMGIPQTDINKLPIYVPRNYKYHDKKCKVMLKAGDKEFEGIFLSVGNPHTVIECKTLNDLQITKYGKIVENYRYFPQKTNVEFVEVVDQNNINVKVWERGVGKTLACGTGAVASAYAMYKEEKVENEVNVKLEGGELKIYIDENDRIFMEGNAVKVFDGEIDL
ncbi:MAG: diaminopimelate epimerase [Clostridia bacterium]